MGSRRRRAGAYCVRVAAPARASRGRRLVRGLLLPQQRGHGRAGLDHRGARVAIVDVDYHHGNGTQQIFYDRDDVLFVSVHADPAVEYPFFLGFEAERGWGAGEDCNQNFPLPAGTGWDRYGPALDERGWPSSASSVPTRCRVAGCRHRGRGSGLVPTRRRRLPADRRRDRRARIAHPLVQEGGYCLDVIGRNVAGVLRELG